MLTNLVGAFSVIVKPMDRFTALVTKTRGQGNMSLSSDEYSNPASETGAGSGAKKARASISEEQREALNLAFFLDPYPGTQATDFLAQELGLEVKSITNWFHNHR